MVAARVSPMAVANHFAGADAGDSAIFNRTIELTGLRRDGAEIPVELSVWPQRADGKWVFNAFIRNIAERRRADAAIHDLNQQLEQRVGELHAANKDLESFSYSIAHDLRSPLTSIQGFAEIILEDHGNEISGEAKDLLQRVIAKTAQMTRLIHELLEFTRLGRRTLRMEPVDLASLVRQALAELERDCEGRAIRFSVSPLGEVRGDPALLKQVFANLLGNAVKFTRHRDPATIEVGGKDIRRVRAAAPRRRIRRNRYWARHRTADHRAPRRTDLGRRQAGFGSHLLFYASARGRAVGSSASPLALPRRRGGAGKDQFSLL